MTRRDDRIAFLVHEPSLWVHYACVWEKLPRDVFAIVLTRRFRENSVDGVATGAIDFLQRVDARGYARVWARDVVSSGLRFGHVVTNHKIGGEGLYAPGPVAGLARDALAASRRAANAALRLVGRPPRFADREFAPEPYWPRQIGDRQVRFMYGADVGDGWSLSQWNAMYDAFLCHGPNDASQVAQRFAGRTFEMGYPRYDAYFDPALDVSAEQTQFVRNPDRKTLLWMPTFGDGACSIPHFAAALKPLQEIYNFVVRPHPLSLREAPQDVRLLESLGYAIDRDPVRDMNRLYRLVDAVLCDYGGSAFGALYLGKRMVLLQVPGSEDWYTVRNSSNLELAQHYPGIAVSAVHRLPALLQDEAGWQQRAAALATLSAKYFADLRGTSSERAASILLQLRAESLTPRTGFA